MTPEQILIDGIDKAPHRGSCQQLWSFKEGRDGSYEIQPCDCWKTETLQAYNEAKAQEATVKESLTVQDLLTAHPLAEALRGVIKIIDEWQYIEEFDDIEPFKQALAQHEALKAQDLITAHPLAEALVKSKNTMVDTTLALFPAYDYLRNPLISQVEGITQTLTQHEALIKRSEAVWAVVEAAKIWNKHPEGSKDSELASAIEALELMEKSQ